MPLGRIQSFDERTGNGYIEPDGGGDHIPFEREAVEDYHTGDMIMTGDSVTYEVEGGMAGTAATHIRRVAKRGYE
jgi:cold shock CspA family protein